MTRRVIPAEVREGMLARLEELEERLIPELEKESLDPDTFAMVQALRRERDQLVDSLRADSPEGSWDPRRIEVGDAVVVREVGAAEDEEYLLVPAGVGFEEGWISDQSPLGAALVGAARGEELEVAAPAGILRYRVVDFRAG